MSETTDVPAGAHARELSRALWFRRPETRCRFLFAADDPEGLVIAPLGPRGTQAIVAAVKRLQAAGRKPIAGAMLVDGDGDAVFCLAGEPGAFLRDLAGWAADHVAAIPALGTLQTAGAARLPASPGADAAVQALDLGQLAVVRDPSAWEAMLRADAASVASILADRLPAERMWFWMSADVPDDTVPLLVQPVAWDPNRDRLDAQIRQLEAEGAGEGVTGHAFVTEQGHVQFVSGRLRWRLMDGLAAWVGAEVARHPALARLAGCQFVLAQGGRVTNVLEDAGLWAGIAPPPAPGTLAAAAAAIAAMSPGEALWLWLTAQAPGGGFLAVGPVAGDEDGTTFGAQVTGFYRRFPESYRDAATGTLTRTPGGAYAVAWHAGAAAGVLAAVARQEQGLRPLVDAAEAAGAG